MTLESGNIPGAVPDTARRRQCRFQSRPQRTGHPRSDTFDSARRPISSEIEGPEPVLCRRDRPPIRRGVMHDYSGESQVAGGQARPRSFERAIVHHGQPGSAIPDLPELHRPAAPAARRRGSTGSSCARGACTTHERAGKNPARIFARGPPLFYARAFTSTAHSRRRVRPGCTVSQGNETVDSRGGEAWEGVPPSTASGRRGEWTRIHLAREGGES